MQFLHSNDIIHRDLKQDNLLLVLFSTEKDSVRAKLSDFGTSKISIQTNSGTKQVGTPAFIVPEVFAFLLVHSFQLLFPFQVITGKKYGKKCDVYSFGMTAWAIDAEEYPFTNAKSEFLLYSKIINGERPQLLPNYKMNDTIQKY